MNMKKLTALILAGVLLSSGMGTAALNLVSDLQQGSLTNFVKVLTYNNSFTDTKGHWGEASIIHSYEYGIMNGMGANRYEPEGTLTVAQAITIAARLHMTYRYPANGQQVLDGYQAASDHWAAPYIAYAVGEGLIDDSEWGNIDRPVTRAETIRIWSNILAASDMEAKNNVNSLPDVTSSTPYFEEIVMFYEAGIVQGSTINGAQYSFNPNGNLSRAEASAMLTTLMDAGKRFQGRSYGGSVVRSFAGTGTSGFSNELRATSFTLPYGLTVDNSGAIIVFDTYNNALRRIQNGKAETLTGQWIKDVDSPFSRGHYRDGILSEALFNRPTDGVYSASGDLYLCDSENHVIRLIRSGNVYTFAGTTQGHADGKGGVAKFNKPMAIAIDKNGILYVADTMNNCIRKVDKSGNVTTLAGVPGVGGQENGRATTARFRDPTGIAVSADGSVVYIADTGNHRICKLENGMVATLSGVTLEKDLDGDPLGDYRDGAPGEAMFNLPKGLALVGDLLFVADSGNNVIRVINGKGQTFTVAGTGEPGDIDGGALSAQFNHPSGLLWHGGMLYIADTTNNMIKTLTVNTSLYK